MTEEIKYCEDCKYFTERSAPYAPTCANPLVDSGERVYRGVQQTCYLARDYLKGTCAPEGRFFEAGPSKPAPGSVVLMTHAEYERSRKRWLSRFAFWR